MAAAARGRLVVAVAPPPSRAPDLNERRVPAGRLARLARFGGLASGIAGSVLVGGAQRLARGQRPALADLLLTPANAVRATRQLSQLRGAAMKLGQLLSLDAGSLLPRELTDILAQLRADALAMPERQLRNMLSGEWGADWRARFDRFDLRPIAAASIGQVHRARTRDGRELAVKVQYPGVRASIDSDIDNVMLLVRLSGLLPPELDVGPVLAEAKRQLHEEADYVLEAAHLTRFAGLLTNSPDYRVPELVPELTTPRVLAMSFEEGTPLEALEAAPQIERDRIAGLLIDVSLRELFAFGLMQTDPNFANYRYDAANGRLVLLDFGATRAIPPAVAATYRRLALAGLGDDRGAMWQAAVSVGLVAENLPEPLRETLLDLADQAVTPLRAGIVDFGDRAAFASLRDQGLALAAERRLWRIPPVDMLFIQRRLGGMYMLASRLRARVDVRALLEPHLAGAAG